MIEEIIIDRPHLISDSVIFILTLVFWDALEYSNIDMLYNPPFYSISSCEQQLKMILFRNSMRI